MSHALNIYITNQISRNFYNNDKLNQKLNTKNLDTIINEFIQNKNITFSFTFQEINNAFEQYLDPQHGGKKNLKKYKKSRNKCDNKRIRSKTNRRKTIRRRKNKNNRRNTIRQKKR